MSYCRWCENSDIYAYESEEGFMIHVAMTRMEGTDRKIINLPYDNRSFCEGDPQSFLSRMLELKSLGYRIPQYTIDTITQEVIDDEKKPDCKSSSEN